AEAQRYAPTRYEKSPGILGREITCPEQRVSSPQSRAIGQSHTTCPALAFAPDCARPFARHPRRCPCSARARAKKRRATLRRRHNERARRRTDLVSRELSAACARSSFARRNRVSPERERASRTRSAKSDRFAGELRGSTRCRACVLRS